MLVRDIDIIKEFLPVNASLEYHKLKAFLADAERMVQECIGPEFYLQLDAYLTNPDPVSEYFDTVIKKLQDAVSFLSFYLGFDILNTVFSNQGFHRVENEEGGKKSLFQRQEENLRRTFKLQGYNKLDLVLEYLETNKSQFTAWAGSSAYTLMKSNFINSTREFSSIYNINNSRLVFMKLRNAQVLAEDFDIIPLIGHDFFDELKSQVAGDNLSQANQKFMTVLKKAVAYRSIFRGGPSLVVELNEYGLYQKEFEANTENFKKESALDNAVAKEIIGSAGQTGEAYLRSCESFLKKNIGDYPLYAGSSAYDDSSSVFDLEGTDKVVII